MQNIILKKTEKDKQINNSITTNMNFLNNPEEIFQKGNKIYIINKTIDESREIYLARVDYIINKLNDINNKLPIDKIINISYIWRNVNFFGMTYSSAIMKML